jgi:hypothetical protein
MAFDMDTGFVVGLALGLVALVMWFFWYRGARAAARAAVLARDEKAAASHARAVRNSIRSRR